MTNTTEFSPKFHSVHEKHDLVSVGILDSICEHLSSSIGLSNRAGLEELNMQLIAMEQFATTMKDNWRRGVNL